MRAFFWASTSCKLESKKINCPDPPILAFFDFLAFFVFRFSLLYCVFFLSFPRISGVPRREKTLAFLGKKKTLAFLKFSKKGKDWRVRVESKKMSLPKKRSKNLDT